MNGLLFMARRYFTSKKRIGLISVISWISVGGFALGVATLIIALSVLGGFEREVRARILDFDSHLRVEEEHDRGLENWKSLKEKLDYTIHPEASAGYALGKALISMGEKQSVIYLKGTDSASLRRVTDIESSIVSGDTQIESGESGLRGLVLGHHLAERLLAAVGDTVVVMSPLSVSSVFEAPPTERFVVAGTYRTNLFDYDLVYAFVPLKSAQRLFRMQGRVSGIEMRFEEFDDSFAAAEKLRGLDLGDVRIMTWFDLHRDLFAAMKLEKWASFIILSLIIVVAAFNVISSLTMMVMEKRKGIGILKAMGATREWITRLFTITGSMAGVFGTLVGVSTGAGLVWLQSTYELLKLPSDVYFIDALPVELSYFELGVVTVVSLLLGIAAAYYPARKAGGLYPVEAIHHE